MNESKNGTVFKSDVLAKINCHIRAYIIDNDKRDVALALYQLFDIIDAMPVREANWLREPDGAWKCSNCGFRIWNSAGTWLNHCEYCGYTMI